MSTEMDLLKQEIERAMDNAPLQKALKNFTTAYPGNRERVYKGYDFEALREKVHEVKSYARDHIDELLDEFEKNGQRRRRIPRPFAAGSLRLRVEGSKRTERQTRRQIEIHGIGRNPLQPGL